jgi:hypothetical protein
MNSTVLGSVIQITVFYPFPNLQCGRIDFLIPMKKWGIELLRNGNRLNAYAA